MKKLNSYITDIYRCIKLIDKRFRSITRTLLLFTTILFATSISPQQASAQVRVSVSFQVFYDNLSPYGSWVNHPRYGYAWMPRVNRRFSPYGTNGHWVYTRHGWTWFSNYSWGWAPFHYGRWFHDRRHGWLWVPDNEWGPGWVSWRRSEGYYGWAPIQPGISIEIAYSNNYNVPYDDWRFVRDRDFGREDINNYYVNTNNYTTIIQNSTVINNIQVDNSQNIRYNAGPDRTEIERRAGRTFNPVEIKESNKPGQRLNGSELEIYRPQVQKNVLTDQRTAPKKVETWKEDVPVKPNPVKEQPIKTNPVKDQPVKTNPVKDQPVKPNPVKDQPVKPNPVKDQPVKPNPVKDQPVKPNPVKDQPVKPNPVKDQPVKPNPVKDQPVKPNPVKDQPVKPNPVKDQPVKPNPVKDQPVKPNPVKDQPVKDPVVKKPVEKQQPIKDQPKKKD